MSLIDHVEKYLEKRLVNSIVELDKIMDEIDSGEENDFCAIDDARDLADKLVKELQTETMAVERALKMIEQAKSGKEEE